MSSLLGQKDSQSDYDGLEVGAQFLVQLRDNGNFAAKEYCSHMDGIRSMMQTLRTTNTTGTASSNIGTAQANGDYLPLFDFGATSTAESALGEESLQDFLADQNLDLQYFYNTPLYDGVSHQLDWLAES